LIFDSRLLDFSTRQSEQEFCQAVRIVTGHTVFDEQVREHGNDPESAHFGQVIHYGCGAVSGVSPEQGGRDGPRIQDRDIKELSASMFMQGAKVVGSGIAARFAGLGHEVTYINLQSLGARDALGNPANEKVGY
jgi:hypothetical protein